MILRSIFVTCLSAMVSVASEEEYYFDILFDLQDDSAVFSNEIIVTDNDELRLSNGAWTCGSCDTVSEGNLLYSELNQIDFGYGNEPREVQVGISAEGMRCVKVSGSKVEGLLVSRESGSCSGPYVTLVLKGSGDVTFNISAYGVDV